MFNVSTAHVERKKFEREGKERGQSFKLKYRVGKSGNYFVISKGLFELLELAKHSAALVPSKESNEEDAKIEAVGIVVLPEGHDSATFFEGSKGKIKGAKFNNSLLEKYLAEAGVIDSSPEMVNKDQRLDLEEWESKISMSQKEDEETGEVVDIIDIDPKGFPLYIVKVDDSIVEEEEEEGYDAEVDPALEEEVEV